MLAYIDTEGGENPSHRSDFDVNAPTAIGSGEHGS